LGSDLVAAINLNTNTKITQLEDDTSPVLAGSLDADSNHVENVKTVSFDGVYDNGLRTGSWSLGFSNGQYQKVTINRSCIATIVTPTSPGTIHLHIYQGASGGVLTVPEGKWQDGVIKDNTTTPDTGHDLLVIHYTGSEYVYGMMQNLQLP